MNIKAFTKECIENFKENSKGKTIFDFPAVKGYIAGLEIMAIVKLIEVIYMALHPTICV